MARVLPEDPSLSLTPDRLCVRKFGELERGFVIPSPGVLAHVSKGPAFCRVAVASPGRNGLGSWIGPLLPESFNPSSVSSPPPAGADVTGGPVSVKRAPTDVKKVEGQARRGVFPREKARSSKHVMPVAPVIERKQRVTSPAKGLNRTNPARKRKWLRSYESRSILLVAVRDPTCEVR